jgi:hypothetical protein
MTTEEQMNNIVDAWLGSTDDSPHDAPLTVARVMARVPQTRQRRSWWRLPFRVRSEKPDSSPAPNVTATTRSMLSPSRMVAALVVLAVGSAFLIVQPFEQGTVEPGLIRATESAPLVEARQRHTSTALPGGKVLVIGGQADDRSARLTTEMWDPETGEVGLAGELTGPRYDHTSTLLPDGRILVVGGYGNDFTWLDTAELWDPETGEFAPTGSLAVGRHLHSASLLPDGRVLVAGGYGGEFEWQTSAEIWDPQTGQFSSAGDLQEPRWDHNSTSLGDGRVLVTGGAESINPQALAEIWDPDSMTFEPAGELAEARSGHTSTLLADGRVMIAGGGPGGEPWDLATVEIWDSETRTFSSTGSAEATSFSSLATCTGKCEYFPGVGK